MSTRKRRNSSTFYSWLKESHVNPTTVRIHNLLIFLQRIVVCTFTSLQSMVSWTYQNPYVGYLIKNKWTPSLVFFFFPRTLLKKSHGSFLPKKEEEWYRNHSVKTKGNVVSVTTRNEIVLLSIPVSHCSDIYQTGKNSVPTLLEGWRKLWSTLIRIW